MGVFEELAEKLRSVAAEVGPAVVGVNRSGSGVVIGPGLVATNAHNLRGEEARVLFADGRTETATLAGADPDGDLAVLAVETGPVTPVQWSDSGAAVGDVVFGVSNPGGAGVRVTFGTVSALGRAFRGPRGRRVPASLEHTAPLSRGSSGGPVVDTAGRVVGINTHRLDDGMYLALPAGSELRATLEGLGRGEHKDRLRLGVALAPARATRRIRAAAGLPEVNGLLVRGVEEDSPASRAGLRRGDVLTSAAGRPLGSPDDLHEALDAAASTLTLTVVRGVDELTVEVTF